MNNKYILCVALMVPFMAVYAAEQSTAEGSSAIIVTPASATGVKPATPPPMDKVQLENYINVMNKELERKEARVKSIMSQLSMLDEDIESRLERVISLLSSVRDSNDSSNAKIRKIKQEVLEALEKNAKYYAQERDKRRKEMGNRYAQIDDDRLGKDVTLLNERIEKRVDQVLDIAGSLAQNHEVDTGAYRDLNSTYVETKEHRNVKHDAMKSVDIKSDVIKDLHASIEKIQRDIKSSEYELSLAQDETRKQQLTNDIATMRKTIEERRNQIEKVTTGGGGADRAAIHKGAVELDMMIDEMAKDLKQDFLKFKNLVIERDMALKQLKPLKDRIERAAASVEKIGKEEAGVDGQKPEEKKD